MKIFLLFLFILFPTIFFEASAQCAIPLLQGTSIIGRECVVNTGKPKVDTFRSVRTWIVKKYPNYSKIVQIEDFPAGQIIYKIAESIPYGRFKSMFFSVTIDIKENKYRCTIDGLSLMGRYSDSYTAASMSDLSIDGDACAAVSRQFAGIELGIREFVVSKVPIIPRPSF